MVFGEKGRRIFQKKGLNPQSVLAQLELGLRNCMSAWRNCLPSVERRMDQRAVGYRESFLGLWLSIQFILYLFSLLLFSLLVVGSVVFILLLCLGSQGNPLGLCFWCFFLNKGQHTPKIILD